MKERPIIFNAEMVRAILDGRKTQTRRLVPAWQLPKHYPDNTENPRYNWMATAQRHRRWGYGVFGETEEACAKELSEMAPCPFGSAGNRLWVRETFRVHSRATDVATLVYRASERNSWTEQTHRVPVSACDKPVSPEKWTPSLHMPRWASRLVLEITDVRVERLRSMSQQDARAEGVIAASGPMEAGLAFRQLWESIYGADSWQVNPWVWVIEFKAVPNGN
ncbi:hypothetical protein AB4K01_15180 [Serratia fonticola]|uniref:hypothetical protein n=1 Tax=Serratia fonticola TaxID=47917 RepID=UPI0034C65C2A